MLTLAKQALFMGGNSASYQNAITNGDLANGATGWSASYSQNIAQDGVLVNTCDGTEAYGLVNSPKVTAAQNDKVYFKTRMRIRNACTSMNARVYSGGWIYVIPNINNPTVDTCCLLKRLKLKDGNPLKKSNRHTMKLRSTL